MSSAKQKLLNQAKKRMDNCEILTPYELPAPLWELTTPLIRELAQAAASYGFPSVNCDGLVQKLYLKSRHGRSIPVSVAVPPAAFFLSIGDISEDSFYLVVKINDEIFGALLWDPSVTVEEVFLSLLDLDEAMEKRGLYDYKTNARKKVFGLECGYRVADVFAKPTSVYLIRDSWDKDLLMSKFDSAEELTVISVHDKRYLCLASHAANAKAAITGNGSRSGTSVNELLQRAVRQHDAQIRS